MHEMLENSVITEAGSVVSRIPTCDMSDKNYDYDKQFSVVF